MKFTKAVLYNVNNVMALCVTHFDFSPLHKLCDESNISKLQSEKIAFTFKKVKTKFHTVRTS